MQEDVVLDSVNGTIVGTLLYKTGYTGYGNGQEEFQSGHYLALHLTCDPTDAEISVYPDYDGAVGGIVLPNHNGDDWVMRVDYIIAQQNPCLKIWASALINGGTQTSDVLILDLSGLTLEPAPE